jgi:hypothetical protein
MDRISKGGRIADAKNAMEGKTKQNPRKPSESVLDQHL